MAEVPMDVLEVIEEEIPLRFRQAAEILEKATSGAGPSIDPNLFYMLALAYKRQNKLNEARTALRKIAKPDANICLQMGILSLRERNFAQAEGELQRAWQMDPASFETGYNLLLTLLTLGKVDECVKLIPAVIGLLDKAPPGTDKRTLQVLGAVLKAMSRSGGGDKSLDAINSQDEQNVLKLFRSLGQIDTIMRLMQALSAARPGSGPIREAFIESVLVKARDLADKCAWTEADMVLRSFVKERNVSRHLQVALLNMLGVCSAMTQSYDDADNHFNAAAKLAPSDARIRQNQAINAEFRGNTNDAEKHWDRFLDLLEHKVPAPPEIPRYQISLEFEALIRIGCRYADKEKWTDAIAYIQRATKLKPEDGDALEKLFFFTRNAKKYTDARRVLDRLRDLRPNDPQLELYELDLIEVKSLADIEKLLSEIDGILRHYPDDARVKDRAVSMVGDIIPLMGNLCDQLTDQMTRVINQVKDLPQYQINWTAVRDVMRDLLKEFQKLRRITGKCLPLVESEDHKRIIRDLADHIDKKMDACRSMGA